MVPLRFSKPPEHSTCLLPNFPLPLQGIGEDNWRHKRSWSEIRTIYQDRNSNSMDDEGYKKGTIYTKTLQQLATPDGWLHLPGSLDQKEPLLSTPDNEVRWDTITSKPCTLAAAKVNPVLARTSTQINQRITTKR